MSFNNSEFNYMVSGYDLRLKLDIRGKWLNGSSRITIVSHGGKSIDELRFVLNHGLKPLDVKGDNIREWRWYRRSLGDLRDLVVNVTEIIWDKPLGKDGVIELTVDYEGGIRDYSYVFPYVKDCIGGYTLIRTDAFSYPILLLGDLRFHDLVSSVTNQRFKYRIEVDVPRGYVVANVSELVDHRVSDEREIYVYVSKVPSWRIDIAIARFEALEEEENDLKVFYLPEDKGYATEMLDALKNCLEYYRKLFGEPARWNGYTIIELPETWGSQADYTGMLLDRKSFTDPYRRGIYHELAHLWNAKSGERVPSRFLDEGFASYFQLLAEKKFIGDNWFKGRLEMFPEKLKSLAEKTPKLLDIPLVDYGKHYLTDASYLIGTLLLYVLHKLVGDQCFYKAIRRFLKEHYEQPATLENFKNIFIETCGNKIKIFLEEWIYTPKPVKLVIEKDVDEIIKQYEKILK